MKTRLMQWIRLQIYIDRLKYVWKINKIKLPS